MAVPSSLPTFQTDDRAFSLLQSSWKALLSPLLRNLVTQGVLLQNVPLSVGANTINHRLGKPLTGYIITRQNALVGVFDTQSTNQFPELTLQLTSNASATVDIYVF